MGRLVIDGKSVYEIDEECVKKRRLPKDCGIYEHLGEFDKKDRMNGKRINPGNKYK